MRIDGILLLDQGRLMIASPIEVRGPVDRETGVLVEYSPAEVHGLALDKVEDIHLLRLSGDLPACLLGREAVCALIENPDDQVVVGRFEVERTKDGIRLVSGDHLIDTNTGSMMPWEMRSVKLVRTSGELIADMKVS